MSADLTKEQVARATILTAGGECDHLRGINISPESVAQVHTAGYSGYTDVCLEGDEWMSEGAWIGTDGESFCVVTLTDGRIAHIWQYEDYTGHGCQCGGAAQFYPTVYEAIDEALKEWNQYGKRAIL
jgi:hypothetical protein